MAVISEIKINCLPDKYQEVEYLESTGTQYIDTKVVPNANMKFVIEMQTKILSTFNLMGLAGNAGGTNTRVACGIDYINGVYSLYIGIAGTNHWYDYYDEEKHKFTIDLKNSKFGIDDVLESEPTAYSNPSSQRWFLFGRNLRGSLNYYQGKIYSCKIYENNNIIRDFIPCYRKSDNVAGVYDLVNKVFYTNSGSGEFLLGKNIDVSIGNVTKYNRETIKKISHDGNIIEGLPAGEYHFARQNEVATILPPEYQQVEYIESNGYQSIDTGVVINTYSQVDVGFQYTSTQNTNGIYDTALFGVGVTGQTQTGYVFNTNYDTFAVRLNDFITTVPTDLKYHDLKFNTVGSRKVILDGVEIATFSKNLTNNRPLYIFRVNQSNLVTGAKAKIYYFKIYDGTGNILRHFIPCVRKSDNVTGLYDTVEKVFYTNNGTGEFVKGVDINIELDNAVNEPIIDMYISGNSIQGNLPSGYSQVEYIESSGTGYIDTGYVGNDETKIVIDYQLLEPATQEIGIIGAVSQEYHRIAFTSYPSYGQVYWRSSGNYIKVLEDNDVNRHLVEINKSGIIVDGINYNFERYSGTNTEHSMYVFGLNLRGNLAATFGKKRVYSCQIYEGNIPKRNFIPCYRKSDNVAGLYDLVENTFYKNKGTGTFTKGEDIIPTPEAPIKVLSVGDYDEATGKYKIPVTINKSVPSEYQQVTHIETTGSAYINTGILPKSTFTYETSIKTPATFGRFWGSYDGVIIGANGTKWRLGAHTAWFDGWAWGEIDRDIFTKFRFDSTGVYINGTFYEHNGFTTVTNNGWAIYLLAVNYQNAPNQNQRNAMEYTRIYDNGELAYNFIPCYRKSDNVIGMYETVNGVFYTNSGSGEFVVGAEVNVTNIYLNEPLRAIYDNYDNILYADHIDYKNRKVVRNTTKFTLDGSQYMYTNATVVSGYQTYHMLNSLYGLKGGTPVYSDKLIGDINWDFAQTTAREQLSSASAVLTIRIADSRGVEFSSAGIQAWLENNPIEVIHALTTPIEEPIDIPEILTEDGTNIFEIETTIQPSEIKINYWKQI